MLGERKHTVLDIKLKDAGKRVDNIHKGLVKYSHRGSTEAREFYYKLASYSAGAVVLSVTFISYLSTTEKSLNHLEFLFASWIFMLMSMFGCIYRNHHHGNFFHYQLNKRYMESKIKQEDLIQQMITDYPEQTYNDHEGIDKLKGASASRQDSYKEAKDYYELRELGSEIVWIYSQKAAHAGFVVGMSLMIAFAVVNLK